MFVTCYESECESREKSFAALHCVEGVGDEMLMMMHEPFSHRSLITSLDGVISATN